MPLSNQERATLEKISRDVTGPVLLSYVFWILHTAQERGLHTLYFLARDGYILQKIAEKIAAHEGLDIRCKYLYCSRVSLRTPSYHLIGEEAYDLLLLGGYHVTPSSILRRLPLSRSWREQILREEKIPEVAWNTPLSRRQLVEISEKLRQNETYRMGVMKASQQAYEATIGYLSQEGLLDQDTVAIVDSGWTGSMQRSLHQLLESAGYQGNLVGFYFGMYAQQKARCDGEYLTWYFDCAGHTLNKILFSNNLFECILSAPHGMTLGYVKSGEYQPVLAEDQGQGQIELIRAQGDAILNAIENQIGENSFRNFDPLVAIRDSQKRLYRMMARPTREEATLFGHFQFSDDIREGNLSPLASTQQIAQLKGYSVPARIWRRLRKQNTSYTELFWPYGTLAFLSGGRRLWYQWNIYLWEWLKYMRNRSAKQSRDHLSQENYHHLIDQHEVVSFDIFDTLLYRTVSKPTDVFTRMEPFVKENCGISRFHERRIQAEQEARSRTRMEDVTIFEIYSAMDIAPELARKLIDYERETEFAILRRDNTMAELLEYSMSAGKKVLILSDMYQSSAFLKEALSRARLTGYKTLYVSSEEKLTKASGNLFRKVAEKEGISNLRGWLHFGDNPYSDYMVPRSLGLDAMLYHNGREAPPKVGLKLYMKKLLHGILGKSRRKYILS